MNKHKYLYRSVLWYKSIKVIAIALLFLINGLIHKIWFDPYAIVSNGDWFYLTPQALQTIQWSSWISSIYTSPSSVFGGVNIVPLRYIMASVYQILSHIHATQQIGDMVLFFLPSFFIGTPSIFLLLYRLVNKPIYAFIGSLFYLTNTFFLVNSSAAFPLVVVYMLTPFLFYLVERFYDAPRRSTGYAIVFTIAIMNLCEIREAVLAYAVIFFFQIYKLYLAKDKREQILTRLFQQWRTLVILVFFCIGTNLYIIASFFSHNFISAVSVGVSSRSLIIPGWLFWQNSLTTFYPFWTGNQPTMFYSQSVPWYFWYIPLYGLLGVLFIKKNKLILFFLALAASMVFWGKGPSDPFPSIYEKAYEHLPFFNLYRDGSKFWPMLLLSYSILIAYSGAYSEQWILSHLRSIKKGVTRYARVAAIVVALPILYSIASSSLPAITGALGPGYTSFMRSSDDINLNHFLFQQRMYFRDLFMPTFSQFIYFSEIHPRVTYNQLPDSLHTISPEILRLMGVKYVILPEDSYFSVYPGNSSPSTYQKGIERDNSFKKISFGKNTVYKNMAGFVPHLYASDQLNEVIGKTFHLDDVYAMYQNKKVDTYTQSDDDSQKLKKTIDKDIQEKVLIASCSSCVVNQASGDADLTTLVPTEESSYTVAAKNTDIQNISLSVDHQEIPLENQGAFFTVPNIAIPKGTRVIKIHYDKKNNSQKKSYILHVRPGKHIYTITLPFVPDVDNTPYFLQFNYTIPTSITTTLQVIQNTDFYFQYQQNKSGGIPWHAFNNTLSHSGKIEPFFITFTTGFNPRQLTLRFITSNHSYKNEDIVLKDVTLMSANVPQIMLYTQKNSVASLDTPSIVFQQLNPTKYIVHIEQAKKPYYLILAENYNPNWRVSVIPDQNKLIRIVSTPQRNIELPYANRYNFGLLGLPISSQRTFAEHFMINEYANAWRIDKIGSYTLAIEFEPEKSYVSAISMSIIIFLCLPVVWLVEIVRKRKNT